MILKKRQEKLKKINDLKKIHERRKRTAEGELQLLKASIAGDMIKASFKGDTTLCDPVNFAKDKQQVYCDKHFWDNANDNSDCKDPD